MWWGESLEQKIEHGKQKVRIQDFWAAASSSRRRATNNVEPGFYNSLF
jgi:hypothetical protein